MFKKLQTIVHYEVDLCTVFELLRSKFYFLRCPEFEGKFVVKLFTKDDSTNVTVMMNLHPILVIRVPI